MNIPSNGYSIGNLSTTTISGTVPYRNNSPVRNGQIKLYTVTDYGTQEEQRTLIFTWFLKDCTIYNNSSVTFSGVDAMAFTNNNYAIGRNVNEQIDTVGTQVQVAATTISSLCGATVTIDASSYSAVNNLRPPRVENNKWSDGIKNLLQRIANFDCENYYTVCGVNSIRLTKSAGSETTYTDTDYAPLTIGISSNTVAGVRVQHDKSVVFANTVIHPNATTADYGIFEFGNTGSRADTMEIVTPFIYPDSTTSQFSALIGKNFGTQFSCANIKVPYNELFIPMTKINFPNDNRAYYIANADYKLTSLGIYASISGTAKAVSDYEYIGKTEKELRNKLAMDYSYSGTMLTQDGIQFVPTRKVEDTPIDSDTGITMGNEDVYGVTPAGGGVFIMGNDIVCSSPIVNVDTSHLNDSPKKIIYEFAKYYIDVTWTESNGIQSNVHWHRWWKSS